MRVDGYMGWYDPAITCRPYFFQIIHELLKIEEAMDYHEPRYYASLHWSRLFEYPWSYNILSPKKDDVILDLASGLGPLQFLLARNCKTVYNFDLDEKITPFIEVGKQKLGVDNVVLDIGDMRNGLPYEDGFFDKVACVSVLEHLDSPYERYVEEAIRVVKVGGIVCFTFDVFVDWDEKKDISLTTTKSICDMLGVQWVSPPPTVVVGEVIEGENRKLFTVVTINIQKRGEI